MIFIGVFLFVLLCGVFFLLFFFGVFFGGGVFFSFGYFLFLFAGRDVVVCLLGLLDLYSQITLGFYCSSFPSPPIHISMYVCPQVCALHQALPGTARVRTVARCHRC